MAAFYRKPRARFTAPVSAWSPPQAHWQWKQQSHLQQGDSAAQLTRLQLLHRSHQPLLPAAQRDYRVSAWLQEPQRQRRQFPP